MAIRESENNRNVSAPRILNSDAENKKSQTPDDWLEKGDIIQRVNDASTTTYSCYQLSTPAAKTASSSSASFSSSLSSF